MCINSNTSIQMYKIVYATLKIMKSVVLDVEDLVQYGHVKRGVFIE